MNTKTTKTIVFAALIAAMILPFGGMQTVYASHSDEHTTPDGSQGSPSEDAVNAEKLAKLEAQLIKTRAEIAECTDETVMDRLLVLEAKLVAAIAELTPPVTTG